MNFLNSKITLLDYLEKSKDKPDTYKRLFQVYRTLIDLEEENKHLRERLSDEHLRADINACKVSSLEKKVKNMEKNLSV